MAIVLAAHRPLQTVNCHVCGRSVAPCHQAGARLAHHIQLRAALGAVARRVPVGLCQLSLGVSAAPDALPRVYAECGGRTRGRLLRLAGFVFYRTAAVACRLPGAARCGLGAETHAHALRHHALFPFQWRRALAPARVYQPLLPSARAKLSRTQIVGCTQGLVCTLRRPTAWGIQNQQQIQYRFGEF